MAEFESSVELTIDIPSGELSDARAAIENEFEDVAVGVEAGLGGGGAGGAGVSAYEERRRQRQIRLAQRRTDDIERIVELLEDIEEYTADISERGGGGGDGILRRLSLGGAGLLGAGGLGLATGLSRVLGSYEWPELPELSVPELPELTIPDPEPIPIAKPKAEYPVEDVDPIEINIPDIFEEESPTGETPGTPETPETPQGPGTPGDTPSPVPAESISRIRDDGLVEDPVPAESISRIRDDGLEEEGVDVGEAAGKGAAGGTIGAVAARAAQGARTVAGAARGLGTSPGGLPIPAPTVPLAPEIGRLLGVPIEGPSQQPQGIQTTFASATPTQPQVNVDVGDVQAQVQTDVGRTVEETMSRIEEEQQRQLDQTRREIERQIENVENQIRRGTGSGIR